ncbi:MAG: histidinol dehydrogenase [Nitrospirae bacterium]|nr:histidinol dehydrogenase [Nitrospirota bacterium]
MTGLDFHVKLLKIIQTDSPQFRRVRSRLLNRGISYGRSIESSVEKIIEDVRVHGDKALIRYTKKFDGISLTPSTLRISQKAIKEAYSKVAHNEVKDLEYAARRIRDFHRHQRVSGWRYTVKGVLLGQRVTPLERVGVYVPGGKAVYPSTVLMSAIPARIAGVKRVIICTPTPKGEINPYILVAADIAGVDEIYTVGGAQAVAAMALGTETIPRVDKIVGPGNIYVAMAKKLLYGHVDIDMIAGPSEILIIADDTADPAFVAMDLLSQAEHDEEAVAILMTPSGVFADRVLQDMESGMRKLSRRKVIQQSLKNYGLIIVTKDLKEAVGLSNEIAPEHLSIQVSRPMELLNDIENAGAIFLGSYTPQTLGDYVAGPNHTLPTGGTARFFSPLMVDDFIKRSSVIRYSKGGLKRDGGVAARFAEIEGLDAHSEAVKIRMRRR